MRSPVLVHEAIVRLGAEMYRNGHISAPIPGFRGKTMPPLAVTLVGRGLEPVIISTTAAAKNVRLIIASILVG